MIYNILLSDISVAIRNPGPREMSSVDVYKAIKIKEKKLEDKKKRIISSNETNYINITSNYLRLSSASSDKRQFYRDNLDKSFQTFTDIKNNKIKDRPLQIYRLEFQKKFALPLSCLFLVCFALPTGLFTKRSGKSVGFGLGLIVSVFYWCLLFAGHTLGIRSSFNPVFSMWLPNLTITIMAVLSFTLRFSK
jgi:lipopolysaccharide export system permease protein